MFGPELILNITLFTQNQFETILKQLVSTYNELNIFKLTYNKNKYKEHLNNKFAF